MTFTFTWSKADTHCLWCGLQKASDAEWAIDHDGHDDENADCWCMARCWGTCGEAIFGDRTLGSLLGELEAQAAVIARVNDGWQYVLPAAEHRYRRGMWWRVQDGASNWVLPEGADRIPQEPMTPAEQQVVYGRVVTEETSDAG